MYNPMMDTNSTNPMTADELFWRHSQHCKICDQHPQSVASFFYEPMCLIGRAYAKAAGLPGEYK